MLWRHESREYMGVETSALSDLDPRGDFVPSEDVWLALRFIDSHVFILVATYPHGRLRRSNVPNRLVPRGDAQTASLCEAGMTLAQVAEHVALDVDMVRGSVVTESWQI